MWQVWLRAESAPSSAGSDATTCLNASRFSPASIASIRAPISSTPYFSSTPLACSSTATLSAVWPPSVASSASGRSTAITRSTKSAVIGST